MTPRKELYITIKEKLREIEELELIDLYRGQFDSPGLNYPGEYTAALVRINKVSYQSMVENRQEGKATVDILFYCKDGWMDQFAGTADPGSGLDEIDLLDGITEKLQFLKGEQFTPMELAEEGTEGVDEEGTMAYRLTFTTQVYRQTAPRYAPRKINLTTV